MAKKLDETKEWRTARLGISLLLNNETKEAEDLFTEHPHSFHIKAGRCFVLFMVCEPQIIYLRTTVQTLVFILWRDYWPTVVIFI